MLKVNSQGLKVAVLGTAVLLSTIGSTYAQQQKGALAVSVEVGPSLFITTGGHGTIGGLLLVGEPHLDYFLTEDLEVGVTAFFYRNIEGVGSRFFFGAAYGHLNYFFSSSSRLTGYIGARLGMFKPNSTMLFGLGPQTGLKFFVTHWLSINGQLDVVIHPATEGTLFLSFLGLGLSYYFY